jgi:hypothetical protein
MTTWERAVDWLKCIFPRGNYRYYIAFFPFCVVSFENLYTIFLAVNLLIGGQNIETATFVYSRPGIWQAMPAWVASLGGNLLTLAFAFIAGLFLFTCISFVVDIGYLARDAYRKIIQVL